MPPCSPWLTLADVCSVQESDFEDGVLERNLGVASALLYYATGRLYPGACSDRWRPICACQSTGNPCLSGAESLRLPGYPILAVDEVRLDGVALVEGTDFVVVDRRHLLRWGGRSWPCRQDLTLPATAVGTFEVAYRFGQIPGPEGIEAAALLAAELSKACGGSTCVLPDGLQSMAREGFSLGFVEASQTPGSFGIAAVDRWVAQVNPGRVSSRPRFLSPDTIRRGARVH